MPRYFFHVHNDIVTHDEEGYELADDSAARQFAVSGVRSVAADSVRDGHLDLRHAIRVTDDRGREVMTVTFGEAIAVAPEREAPGAR